MKRVCIIGGGISGLCVAYYLKRAGIETFLFEKGKHLGGNIASNHQDGFLIESGPNSTLTTRELLDLISDLGLNSEIATPQPSSKNRYILRKGKLLAMPSSILAFARTEAFSMRSKLAILAEPLKRNRRAGDTVAAFFERRLGREIVDYAVDPFISGIYAGDPHKLALEYAFPKIDSYERERGSIILGALLSPKAKESKLPKGTPRSLSFKAGMQTIVDALLEHLGDAVRSNCGDVELSIATDGKVKASGSFGEEIFDCAVISTPAYAAANVLRKLPAAPVAELASVYYPPVSVVYTAYRKADVANNAAGFGFLVPSLEKRKILGSLWTSSVFEGRAPAEHHLFTTFVGGSRNPDLCEQTDEDLIGMVASELGSIMDIKAGPVFSSVKKWPRAIPQYNIGYDKVYRAIDDFRVANPQVFLCANYYNGISVSDCIKNAGVTAAQIKNLSN